MGTISLKLPKSLHKAAHELAKSEKISMNQLITLALAEKLAALTTAEYLEERSNRASRVAFEKAMAKVADVEPDERDRL
jgi:hypothetical protein